MNKRSGISWGHPLQQRQLILDGLFNSDRSSIVRIGSSKLSYDLLVDVVDNLFGL